MTMGQGSLGTAKKTVLVTGGAGYVGSHAAQRLAKAGWSPVVFDNLSSGHEWAVKWGPLEVGDLLDFQRLCEVFKKHKPVAVMHFAARSIVSESQEQPLAYYRNNVEGTYKLLQAMREQGCGLLVFSSTCALYGDGQDGPIPESAALRPTSVYARSKLAMEMAIEDTAARGELAALSLRYFNAAGAEPQAGIGELHDPETHAIPNLLLAAAGLKPAFELYGQDYPTADGTALRDYIHVSDLAEAHLLALEALMEGRKLPPALNLGRGEGLSVRQLYDLACEVSGQEIDLIQKPRRPGDPAQLTCDPALALKVLNWQAQHQDAKEILESAWDWLAQALQRGLIKR